MKQATPTTAEVRTTADGNHEVFESSALPPFAFTKSTVHKVDTYMAEWGINGTRKNPLKVGFAFFKRMFNSRTCYRWRTGAP